MSQVEKLAKIKNNLILRSAVIRLMREWFWAEGFLEMETPQLLCLPGQEPYLSPMRVALHNERGEEFAGYLHTSPEYSLKKMLAAGFPKIFSICKVFRDHESFGGTHNPEFTMIEWYRGHSDMFAIMKDCEDLWQFILGKLKNMEYGIWNMEKTEEKIPNSKFQILNSKFERLHMREAWQKYAGVNLDEYLEKEKMFALCAQKGYGPKLDESYEDLFYRIFLNEIEPHLGKERPTIVHHYPKPMAALCRLSAADPNYAERFELYVEGLELANAFGELTDKDEQLRRLEADREQRQAMGKDVFGIDREFVEAVGRMPPSGGIALGVDRLVQLLTGCQNINDVIALPASQLFN